MNDILKIIQRANSEKVAKKVVIIVTFMRSGSTFLGETFNVPFSLNFEK